MGGCITSAASVCRVDRGTPRIRVLGLLRRLPWVVFKVCRSLRRRLYGRFVALISGQVRRDEVGSRLFRGGVWGACMDFGDENARCHFHGYQFRPVDAFEGLQWAMDAEAYFRSKWSEGFSCVRFVLDVTQDGIVEYIGRHTALKLLPEVVERLNGLRIEIPRARYGRALGGRFGALLPFFIEASREWLKRGHVDVPHQLEVRGKRFAVPTTLKAKARVALGLPEVDELRAELADLRRALRLSASRRGAVHRSGRVSEAVAVRQLKDRRRRNAER